MRAGLRPGGRLVITLDNLANPAVAVRNALPYPLRLWLRLVPYSTGASVGPAGLRRALGAGGFEVREVTPIPHCPRAPSVGLAAALDGRRGGEPLLHALALFERLERLPARFRTGYYVAALAVRHYAWAP